MSLFACDAMPNHRIEITQKANSRIFDGHACGRGLKFRTSLYELENNLLC